MALYIYLALFSLVLFYIYVEVKKHNGTRGIRHVKTGAPMPSRPYLYWLWELFYLMVWTKQTPREYEMATFENEPPISIHWYRGEPEVMISNPDSVMQILLHKDTDRIETSIVDNTHIEKVIGNSLVVASDAVHGKRLRKLLDPAFKHTKLASLMPTFVECTENMLDIVEDLMKTKNVINITRTMKNLTFEIIGRSAFGYTFNCIDGTSKKKEQLELFFEGMTQPFEYLLGPTIFNSLMRAFPTPYQKRLAEASEACEKLVYDVVRDRVEGKNDDDPNKPRAADLLDHILEADGDDELTDHQIVKNIYLFFLAGQETSASTLVSVFYFLALYQDVQEKLLKEVLKVLGDDGVPTSETIGSFVYLEALMKESLRINTPVYQYTTRKALKDLVIDDYHIPEGTSVAVNLLATHMSKRFWGETAEQFIPERFLGAEGAHNSKQFFAFSQGPRICIGKKFALWEIKTIIALTVRKYHIVGLKPGWVWRDHHNKMTTEPYHPLEVIFERRQK